MHVNDCYGLVCKKKNAFKILPALKLTAIWLIATMLTAWRHGDAQPITLSQKNVPLQAIFQELKRQTGFTFVYTQGIIQKAKKVTVNVKNATLETVLNLCFKEQPL